MSVSELVKYLIRIFTVLEWKYILTDLLLTNFKSVTCNCLIHHTFPFNCAECGTDDSQHFYQIKLQDILYFYNNYFNSTTVFTGKTKIFW